MAFEEQSGGTGMYMPVAPAYGNNGGFGGFGGDWGWIILLLLFAGGGWGNGFGGGFGEMYPWLNNSNQINGGFRDQMINDNITGIRSSLGDISTQLCNGFNQTQMNTLQAVNGIQAQLAQCCCDNRLATCQTQNVIATEAAATRAANTQNTQAILDKLCALELDGYKRENENLRAQLNMANLAASQTAQTARILADNAAQTVALEQYLNPAPIPAYAVQNPNCCQQKTCGGGAGF